MAANSGIALRAAVLLAMACTAGFALAQDVVPPLPASGIEEASLAELEDAFWVCDYIATTRGVTAAPRAACRSVTEEVKKRKFGGDFERFVAWWRDNKVEQYARVERLPGS
jgi:hypothetical protein